MAGRELVLRRARGYAPLPIRLAEPAAAELEEQSAEIHLSAVSHHPPVLAVGAQLKNTIALSVDRQVFLSQHIGDLETHQAFDAFRRVISDFERLYERTSALFQTELNTFFREDD